MGIRGHGTGSQGLGTWGFGLATPVRAYLAGHEFDDQDTHTNKEVAHLLTRSLNHVRYDFYPAAVSLLIHPCMKTHATNPTYTFLTTYCNRHELKELSHSISFNQLQDSFSDSFSVVSSVGSGSLRLLL